MCGNCIVQQFRPHLRWREGCSYQMLGRFEPMLGWIGWELSRWVLAVDCQIYSSFPSDCIDSTAWSASQEIIIPRSIVLFWSSRDHFLSIVFKDFGSRSGCHTESRCFWMFCPLSECQPEWRCISIALQIDSQFWRFQKLVAWSHRFFCFGSWVLD